MSQAEPWDVLHNPGPADQHWTTDNVGEAAPGVLSPLSMSMWLDVGDRMPREVLYRMGVFSARDRAEFPLIVRPFFGRIALRAEYMAAVGDRMPGVTGEDTVANMFGTVPETMRFEPTRARYPAVAAKVPGVMWRASKEIRAKAAEVDAWWRSRIAGLPGMNPQQTRAVLAEGNRMFFDTLLVHVSGLLPVVQPLLVELTKLVERAGVGDVGELSGSGGAEMAIVEDIWRASRDQMTLEQVIANHGFHGPLEGETSSRVWREDPEPLRRVIASYADKSDEDSPVLRAQRAKARLPELQRQVIAALPSVRRPGARLVLHQAARLLPMRGVGKRSFLQAMDVCRASARQLGEQLDVDAFNLTMAELTGVLPPDAAQLAERRAARRREYQAVSIVSRWRGEPEATPIDPGAADGTSTASASDEPVTGIGVSSGVVEGVVRVVHDPSFTEVEDGEVLVTPTTDPSWASIMFVSAALVVDIGGTLSHAAVVARELGIPCVVNTRNGSRQLRTGDRVRVDGGAGTVEVLERASAPAAAPADAGQTGG